jgi:hypothetical protein
MSVWCASILCGLWALETGSGRGETEARAQGLDATEDKHKSQVTIRLRVPVATYM